MKKHTDVRVNRLFSNFGKNLAIEPVTGDPWSLVQKHRCHPMIITYDRTHNYH